MLDRKVSDFRKSEDGAVAIIFSMSLIVILGAVGAAIDYTRMSGMRAELQAASDSAVLAGVPSYAGSGAISSATTTAIRQALDGGACFSFTPSGQYPATPGCGSQYYSFNSYLNDDGGSCAAGDVYATADNNDPVSHGSGATKICKYKGQSVANVSSAISGVNGGTGKFPAGPNVGCSIAPLTTLTNDVSLITGSGGALSKMAPNGDTSLLPGFMWAWRTISPLGAFATTGASGNSSSIGSKRPKPYGQVNNTKIIVLMTDGFDHWVGNPYSPYQSMYSALGFYVNGRVSNYGGSSAGPTTAANYRAQMDAALPR